MKRYLFLLIIILFFATGCAINQDNTSSIVKLGDKPENIKVKVNVYFPNTVNDPEMLDCTNVYPVEREVEQTLAVGRATISELLQGPTAEEEGKGYITSINQNVVMNNLTIEDGTALVDFNEQFNFQVGGSCRVASIQAQVVETLKQFPTVDKVVILVNGHSEGILEP